MLRTKRVKSGIWCLLFVSCVAGAVRMGLWIHCIHRRAVALQTLRYLNVQWLSSPSGVCRFAPWEPDADCAVEAVFALKCRDAATLIDVLPAISEIKVVYLPAADYSNVDLSHLCECAELSQLMVAGAKMNDKNIQDLARLPALEILGLSGTKLPDDAVFRLAKFRRLKVVELRTCIDADRRFATPPSALQEFMHLQKERPDINVIW